VDSCLEDLSTLEGGTEGGEHAIQRMAYVVTALASATSLAAAGNANAHATLDVAWMYIGQVRALADVARDRQQLARRAGSKPGTRTAKARAYLTTHPGTSSPELQALFQLQPREARRLRAEIG
jgi:hypothetical protein